MRSMLAASTAEFLALTHLWRELLDLQVTEVNMPTYELFSPDVIESVLWVTLDGQLLTPTDVRFAPPSLIDMEGRPTHYWLVDDKTLRLFPSPDAVYNLRVMVALKPSRTAIGVADWVYETWADAIVSGAIHRLAQIPDKTWTDQQLAAEHRLRFERAVSNAVTRDLRQINLRVRNVRVH